MEDSERNHSWRFWFAWLVASELAVVILPTWLVYGHPVWSAERVEVAAGLAIVQLVTAVGVLAVSVSERRPPAIWAPASAVVLLGILYLTLLLARTTEYSRAVLLFGSLLVVASSVLPALWVRARWAAIALAGSVVFAAPAIRASDELPRLVRMTRAMTAEDGTPSRHVRKYIRAAHYVVQADYYEGWIPTTRVTGGALDAVGDQIVVMTGDGRLYVVRPPATGDSLTVRSLGIRAPLNHDAFVSATPPQVTKNWFRAADVMAERVGDRLHILVSHHYWKTDEECFVLRVSELYAKSTQPDRSAASPRWRTVHETEPCLELKRSKRGHLFAGLQAGGRLAPLGPDRYLLTVGDHEFDGWNSERTLSQSPAADYGKTLVLQPGREATVFTTGHRNPQGLHVGRDGRIWSTEHGPEGGDELNLLLQDRNYGWPFATLGTQYGRHEWPLADTVPGEFTSPVFAWTPSIGVSNLTTVRNSLFDRWTGDLLIASLKARTLYRARITEDRVVNVEPLQVHGHIRDVIEAPSGRIVLMLDSETLVFLSPANRAEDGAAIFAAQCSGCHETEAGPSTALGPTLDDVYMRRIAWRNDFDYSNALESLGSTPEGVWNEENLNLFLENPQAFAPGTSMDWLGLGDVERRRALIEYLGTL